MSTMTEGRDEGAPAAGLARNAEIVKLPRCSRCDLTYMVAKSTSALKLTYCSFLCELGDLGFSMSGLESMELVKKEEAEAPEPEPVGVD
ncbi:MAG: hypothetical protein WD557_15735 [Dehalococcoidia bacterium]